MTKKDRKRIRKWHKIIKESGKFDKVYYLKQNPDVRKNWDDPIEHYLLYGAKEGRDPNAWFDSDFYLAIYSDVRESGINPFVHYLLYGMQEGRACKKDALENENKILETGERMQAEPVGREWTEEERESYRIIHDSGLFDEGWYLDMYEEARRDPRGGLEHYIEIGQYRGDNPTEWFDAAYYMQTYPDVRESGLNPFAHYILYGKDEGRLSKASEKRGENKTSFGREWTDEEKEWYRIIEKSGLFDAKWYVEKYEDVRKDPREPLAHYVEIGIYEDRKPNKWFDPIEYRRNNKNVFSDKLKPFVHYILFEQISKKTSTNKSNIKYFERYKYKVEAFDVEHIKGWIVDLNDPEKDILLDLYVNGKKVITTKNNKLRNDLKRKGISKGRGGFYIKMKNSWLTRAENRVSLNLDGKTIESNTIKKIAQNKYKLKIESVTEYGIRGWLIDIASPEKILDLKIFIDGTLYGKFDNSTYRGDLKRVGLSNGTGGIDIQFIKEFFDPGNHTIDIVTPDGEKYTFDLEIKKQSNRVYPVRKTDFKDVAVIVPIYNAADDVRICIERLKNYTSKDVEVFLIDDSSTDKEINQILNEARNYRNFRIYRNKKNLGFTKTVNRGINLAKNKHVVLLNSDARVTPRWLDGMLTAMDSDDKIATVTAMSDRAGAFSAPKIGNDNELPFGVSEIEYALAFRRRSKGLYPTVPTGNGFCMLIRRDTIDEIGALDEEAFPRGYGEENDFCMRARKEGWRNIIDDRTYVFHDRSKSFKESKNELIKAGREVIDRRYPDYAKAIRVFKESPLINAARFFAAQAMNDCLRERIKERILYVVSTQTGGTPQTNRDLMGSLQAEFETWVLRCNSQEIFLSRYTKEREYVVEKFILDERVEPLTHRSREYESILHNILEKYQFDLMHIRHIAWHSIYLPKIAKNKNMKVIFSFHDFYTVCPTVKLLNGNNEYCRGVCNCVNEDCKIELWDQDAVPKICDNWIYDWRDKFKETFNYVDAFITTSNSAKQTIVGTYRSLEDKEFHIIPHGRDLEFYRIKPKYDKNGPFHILIPGNINIAKGLDVIKGLLEEDRNEKLFFHILGTCSSGGFKHERMIYHGAYERDKFYEHVKKIEPTVGAVFSIWDETWCHTLTELWSVGLPVLALDFGTLHERIVQSGAGWLYGNDLSYKDLYNKIIEDLSNETIFKEKIKSVYEWQKSIGLLHNNRYMAINYLNVYYRHLLLRNDIEEREIVGVVCPADKHQNNAPGSTYIRIWERTLNDKNRPNLYLRLSPEQLVTAVESGNVKKAIIQRNVLNQDNWRRIKKFVLNEDFKYLYDIDDDLLNVPQDKDPEGIYRKYSIVLKDIIGHASLVTTSTERLLKRLSVYNKNIVLLPNALSPNVWRGKVDKNLSDNSFKLLYMGSKTHKEDLLMILEALDRIAEKYKNFSLKIVGITDEKVELKSRPWIEFIEIPDKYKPYPNFVKFLKDISSDVDLGIAPLVDNEFNLTKSNLKILEYAALSLPVLASKTSVYDSTCKEAPYATSVRNTTEDWYKNIDIYMNKNRQKIRNEGLEMSRWVYKKHFIKIHDIEEFDMLVSHL